jgi:hypothetical protein
MQHPPAGHLQVREVLQTNLYARWKPENAVEAHAPFMAETVSKGVSYSAHRKVLESFQNLRYRCRVVAGGYSSFRSFPAVNTGRFNPLQNRGHSCD